VTEVSTGSVTCEKCGALMDSRANRSFFAYARIPGTNDPLQLLLAMSPSQV